MAMRKTKRKRTETEIPEVTGAENPTNAPEVRKPSGYPFTDSEVEWVCERGHLASKPHKVIPGGCETLSGDVNAMLRHIGNQKGDLVRNSVLGEFTRLNDVCTKSGNMIHYMVSRQVVPNPNFDPTSLFFRIGKKILRFSREEYALVSGLKFGHAAFDPYADHDLPANSIYEKLFGASEDITMGDVRAAYVEKQFMVNNRKISASKDDLVKLSKLLLCLGFVMGYDLTKKKIPRWIWVLLEDEVQWEAFPWESLSFQYLKKEIDGVKKEMKGRIMNYTLNGNTIALSAWAFEAVPCFGEKIGHKFEEVDQPRFMRYIYKKGGFPSDEDIEKVLVRRLKPYTSEKETPYWKSLQDDPLPQSFAFQYKSNGGRKKKKAGGIGEGGDETMGDQAHVVATTLSAAQLDQVAEAAAKKVLAQMKDVLKEFYTNVTKAAAESKMKKLLEEYHNKLVQDVADKVTSSLLAHGQDDLINEPTHVDGFHMQQAEGEEETEESEEETEASEKEATREEPPESGSTMEHHTSAGVVDGQPSGATEATWASEVAENIQEDQHDGQHETITDTQLETEFDLLARADEVTRAQRALVVAMNVRPLRIIYPAKACRSPYMRDDVHPGPGKFEEFMENDKDEMRNVGLFFNVYKEFFQEIMTEKRELGEDHVNAYISILASQPAMAGIPRVKRTIGITSTSFMSEVKYVFSNIFGSQEDKHGMYDFDKFVKHGEDVIPEIELERLVKFAEGTLPEWGDFVKSWLEYDRVLAICVTSGGWTLTEIHLKKQKLIIHDAKGYKLQHQHEEKDKIKRSFIPMLRVLPQILKSIGYYKQHRIKNPKYDQFRFAFGPFTGRMAFREVDAADGALYCMKHIKFLVSAISIERGLENPQAILDYRRHVAKTIYAHSTDAEMVSYSQNVDNNDKKGKSPIAFNLDAKD